MLPEVPQGTWCDSVVSIEDQLVGVRSATKTYEVANVFLDILVVVNSRWLAALPCC